MVSGTTTRHVSSFLNLDARGYFDLLFCFIWLGTCSFAHVVWFFDEIEGFIIFFFRAGAFVDTGGPTLVNDNPLG